MHKNGCDDDLLFTRMAEKWLTPNQRIALGFEHSGDIGWIFARILGVEPTRYRPFVNGLTPINPNGTLGLTQLLDPASGDPIFDVPVDLAAKLLYHVGIGLNPAQYMRTYVGYPSGNYRGRIEGINAPTQGNDYSYVTGEDSPYGDPTDAMEFFFPFGVTADFAFSNEDPERIHQPVLDVEIRKYRVDFLDPAIPEHADMIKRMALGVAPAYWFQLGTIRTLVPYTQEQYWGVSPLSIAEARALSTGGK